MNENPKTGTRLAIAAAVFCALLPLAVAVPGIIMGDTQAISQMLLLGAGMSVGLFVAIMMIALPLYIVFGRALKNNESRGKLAGAFAGAIIAFLVCGYPLGGFSGQLADAAFWILTLAGAVGGWLLVSWMRPVAKGL